MTKLPQVRKEVSYSLYRHIDSLEEFSEKSAYLSEFWQEFKKEQYSGSTLKPIPFKSTEKRRKGDAKRILILFKGCLT